MRTVASTRFRQAGVVLVAAVAVMTATGCQAVNEQATEQSYDPSDGVSAKVGDVDLRNVFVAAAAEGAPARLGGAFFNDSGKQTTVTLSSSGGSEAKVSLPANADYYLSQQPAVTISEVSQPPGSMVELTITDTGSSTSSKVNVPVVDGTLSEYRTIVPGSPTPTGTASVTPTATATATESAQG